MGAGQFSQVLSSPKGMVGITWHLGMRRRLQISSFDSSFWTLHMAALKDLRDGAAGAQRTGQAHACQGPTRARRDSLRDMRRLSSSGQQEE